MTTTSRSKRLVAATSVVVAVVCFAHGTAFAADHGNWDTNRCGDRGEICNWRGDRHASKMNSSSTRDSSYAGNSYSGGQEMTDYVKVYDNRFSTLKVRSYRHDNYVSGSTCLSPGLAVGPYSNDGSDDGLSSFKSC